MISLLNHADNMTVWGKECCDSKSQFEVWALRALGFADVGVSEVSGRLPIPRNYIRPQECECHSVPDPTKG